MESVLKKCYNSTKASCDNRKPQHASTSRLGTQAHQALEPGIYDCRARTRVESTYLEMDDQIISYSCVGVRLEKGENHYDHCTPQVSINEPLRRIRPTYRW